MKINEAAMRRKRELWDAARATITDKLKPAVYALYADVDALEVEARRFIGSLKHAQSMELNDVVRVVTARVLSFRDNIVYEQAGRLCYNLLRDGVYIIEPRLAQEVAELTEELAATIKEYGGLKHERCNKPKAL